MVGLETQVGGGLIDPLVREVRVSSDLNLCTIIPRFMFVNVATLVSDVFDRCGTPFVH